jgi:cytochrome c oxidase subunit 2
VLEIVIAAITAFVFVLLAIVIVRFRKKVHPVASKRTHNAPLEVLWTIVPVLILAALWWPSVKLTYYMDKAKNPEMTIKVTGHQWYWGYEYPDAGIDEYPSNMIPPAKIDKAKGQIRLLSVDQPLVIPVDTEIQYLITGSDVIHSWYIPSFGINKSAMPGRTNESWARALREGVFYGQCSKICGVNHGQMPIEVRVVSKEKFKEWAAMAKTDGVDKANKAVLGLQAADNDSAAQLASAVKQ